MTANYNFPLLNIFECDHSNLCDRCDLSTSAAVSSRHAFILGPPTVDDGIRTCACCGLAWRPSEECMADHEAGTAEPADGERIWSRIADAHCGGDHTKLDKGTIEVMRDYLMGKPTRQNG